MIGTSDGRVATRHGLNGGFALKTDEVVGMRLPTIRFVTVIAIRGKRGKTDKRDGRGDAREPKRSNPLRHNFYISLTKIFNSFGSALESDH